ncbi:MAG: hypothetical protein M3Z24_11650 [Chloroflexota bacterium]|nr:hypothetical protein [Chloroflexota bacterium]
MLYTKVLLVASWCTRAEHKRNWKTLPKESYTRDKARFSEDARSEVTAAFPSQKENPEAYHRHLDAIARLNT